MTRITRLAVAAFASLALIPAAALAAPDRSLVLTGAGPKLSWDGASASGANTSFNLVEGECGKAQNNYCEESLVFLNTNNASGVTLKAVMDGFSQTNDFDLKVYKSNAAGAAEGDEIGERSTVVSDTSPLGTDDPRYTGPGDFETVTVAGAKGYFLIRVIYFAVNNGAYKGTVEITGAPAGGGTTPPPSGGSTPPPSGGSTPPPSGGSTPPPSGGSTPAALTVTLGGIPSKAKVAAAKGLKGKLKCSVACKGTVTASIDAKTAKKLKLGKAPMKIGNVGVSMASAGEKTFAIKASAKVKKALKKAKKITVFLSAAITDSSGGQNKTVNAKLKLA
jgi:hypothetical protein